MEAITFTEFALRMYPFWIMGIVMMLVVYFSKYKNLLRIEKHSLIEWIKLIGILTVYRIIVFHFFGETDILKSMTSGAMSLPWQSAFTVFWEDALHGLPLAILAIKLGMDKTWKKVLVWSAIAMVAISFGLGHSYQGIWAAILLSAYVPFTFKKGQEIGFGTIMLCHMIYDLATIITLNYFFG